MSNIAIQGAATGTGVFTLASPATNTNRTLTLPDEAGTVLVNGTTSNVGIGTSSPTVPIHVVNASTPRIYVGSDASKYAGVVYTAGTTFGSVAIRGQGNDIGTVVHVDRDNSQVRFDTGGSERMRIDSAGHAIVPNGITLGTAAGTYAAANTLDDYEEGTFTPALEIGGSTSGITYSEQVGLYVKIGTFCYVQITISLSSKGSNSGVLTFNNLPFLSDNTDGARGGGTVNFFGAMSGVNGAPTVYGEQGTYRTGLYDAGNSIVALSQMDNTNLTNSTYMRITYVYQTNS